MKEQLIPRGYKPEEVFHEGKEPSIWESPESPLFVEWYFRQSELSPEEQAPQFTTFLELVSNGEANLPSDEQIARYKIEKLRSKN